MLRVGLDLRPTEVGFKAHAGRGTGRYTSELVDHMMKADTESVSLVPVHSEALAQASWEKTLLRVLPAGTRTFDSQYLFPRRISKLPVDLIHFFSHGDAPARSQVPYIVSVLDLIPLRFPDLYKADKPNWRFRFARWLEYEAIRRARGIVAISEATKCDLIELLGVSEEKIAVTPLAVSRRMLSGAIQGDSRGGRIQRQRERLQLPVDRKLLLYVGGIDPRKNVLFLLEVFAELLKLRSDRATRPLLLLAGNYELDDQFPRIRSKIAELGISSDIRLLGFVPDEELASLYQAADLFVFPSLYEGFGFPVLEAMACGTPVVAGSNSSLPEVAGTSSVLLPDMNTGVWVQAIDGLLENETALDDLSVSGINRAQKFSWERTASDTLDAYRRFAGAQDEMSKGKTPLRASLGR